MAISSTTFKKGHKPMGGGHTGHKMSQYTKDKLLLANFGKPSPMKGKHHTQETIEKIREARKKQVGDKCPTWKGGITPVNVKIRNSIEGKLWRKSIFERDNFTDQKTGQRGGNLVAHHINNFADFPELRTSIENGITLSKESHELFHKNYGKKNNTREQLEEFLGRKLLTS